MAETTWRKARTWRREHMAEGEGGRRPFARDRRPLDGLHGQDGVRHVAKGGEVVDEDT
jgi:hypothetical protein